MLRFRLLAALVCVAAFPAVLALQKRVVNSTFVPVVEETYDGQGVRQPYGGAGVAFGQTTYTAELQDKDGNVIATEDGYGKAFNEAADNLFYWVDTFVDGSGSVIVQGIYHSRTAPHEVDHYAITGGYGKYENATGQYYSQQVGDSSNGTFISDLVIYY